MNKKTNIQLPTNRLGEVRERIANTLNRIPTSLLIVIFSLLPVLITIILIRFVICAPITQYMPVTYNDEAEYWHEISTFGRAGLNGGYYAFIENPPAVPLFHFGIHGPIFAIFYGIFAKVFGWSYFSGLYVNLAVLGCAFALYAWGSHLDQARVIAAGLSLLTVWPVLFFSPVNMAGDSPTSFWSDPSGNAFLRYIPPTQNTCKKGRGNNHLFTYHLA